MTNSKLTKRSLLASSISLLLCFAMLLGTTFAWFTDNVSTTNNIITAGNLDIELYYLNDETADWTKVNSETNVFKENTLWEPGHTEVVKLKVVNEGTLDLKYQLGVNIASEIGSVNVAGDKFKLSDYIKYAIVEGEPNYSDSASAAAAVDANANKLNVAYDSGVIELDNGADKIVTLVVYMPTTVTNEANYGKGQAVPTINLGINLYSTQLTSEDDSFGDQYDAEADYYIHVNPENIQEAIHEAKPGDVLYLDAGSYGNLVIENADGTPKKGITLAHNTPGVNPTSAPFNVGQIDLNGSENITIRGIYFDIDKAQPVYKKDGTATGYVASIVGSGAGDNVGAKNIVIENCKFNATSNNHPDYIAICFEEQGKPTSRATNITVKGCMLDKQAFNFIRANYLAEGTVIVEKNSLPGGATHSALNFTGNAADLKIRNNSFGFETMSGRLTNTGWNKEKAMLGTSRQGSNKIKIEVIGNTFIQETLGAEGHVIELKKSYNEDNCDLIFEGNTFKAGLAGMTEDTVPCIWHN